MPLNRYDIRNEYGLADPELYRGADKDDPEALLEGVAMAGLVGVLRQLGDLAEFAAETFHNLHEEVMSTAARGHSLMVRVQQLETEVPAIEKASLSQTDHSSFFYNDGVDWRSNLKMDENLITRGNLPRFIMDSYEESRPPPRLFLLDKFDIAGAGACLKRYSDPSIFKAEISGITSTDVQREMKILRPKKKVSQRRDGQTAELLPTSHTKLHQLLLEEHVELGVSNPTRRVKLKRKLNGFPFDSKTGKSYMEKLLMPLLPDDKLLVKVNSPATLMVGRSDQSRLEVRSVSPDRGNSWRKRSPPSPDREDMVLNPSTYAPTGDPADDKIITVPDLYYSFATKGFSRSTSDKMSGEKVIAVDAESSREGRTTDYESYSITSDTENFVDAPLTMESDTDTEPKLRMKNDFTSPIVEGPQQFSGTYEEHINYRSSDSLSIGGSMISDEGNNSSRKEISSFSSHSRSTSAENPHPERYVKGFPSTDIPGTEIVGALSHSSNQHASDFGQVTSRLASDESMSSSVHSDLAGVVTKYMLREPGSDERASTSRANENVANLVGDASYHHHSVSDFTLPSGNVFARPSAGEHLKNERNAERISSMYTAPGNFPTTKSSITMPLDSGHGEESNHNDGNQVENTNSRLNMPNVRSRRTIGTRKLSASKYPVAGILANRFPKLLENNSADHPDMVGNRNNMTRMVPQKESIVYPSDNRDSNISVDAPVSSPGKKLKGISWSNVRTADTEVNHPNTSTGNQIRSNNFVLPHLPISVDCLHNGQGADEEIIPEQHTLVHENFTLGSSKSYVVLGSSGKGTVDDVSPNNSEALESSCHMLEKIEKSVGRPDQFDSDGSSMSKSFSGKESTEFSDSAPETSVRLDRTDSDREKSLAVDLACTELSGSQDVVVDNVHTKVVIEELEEHVHGSEHSGADESECNKSYLVGMHGEASLVDEVVHGNAAAEDFETVLGNGSNIDYPKSEIYETVHNSHLDLEVANDLHFGHATIDQSIGDQTGMGSEHVYCQQSHLENHVSDAMILPADYGTEQSKAQEKSRLQPNQLVQELLHSELSMLPIHHQQMVDYVDHKGDNYASKFSLDDHPNSVSVSEPQIQNDMDASGYHKKTVDPILTPYGSILGKNQIIPPDQPALPPLPPVQWRIGRLQHASSCSEVELKREKLSSQLVSTSTPLQWRTGKLHHASSTVENDVKELKEELSPQLISTHGFSSTSLTVSADVASPSRLILPTDDISSSVEDSKHTVVRIASEEKVENYSASLESKIDHEVGDLQPIIRSDQKQLVISSAEGESALTAEEELAHQSHSDKLALNFDSIVNDDAGLDKSQPSDVTDQVKPQVHKVNGGDSLAEQIGTKDTPEPIDLHQMVKSKQPHFVLPTPRSEILSLAEEDGAPSCSHTGELAEPCATLEVATALDNVSDVKEPDWPQVQKVDERELLSEQVGMEHMHERVDHPAVIESKQQVPIMPISESHTLLPDEEIDVPHGSHSGKLSHPHDTLTEDVAGCEKSKQSEVKDQVRPPVQEVDATDSVSEQMRTKDTETSDVQPPIQINPQQLVLPTPESVSVSPADENIAAHGSHTVKQRFPHNPLVEDISILDRSKLRKVTDRVKSQTQRVDENGSFLEQIRAKSFNLRHAATSRPSIPGPPQTNIKVAAILEKANAIRQAVVGSDEDDDDSWSDS